MTEPLDRIAQALTGRYRVDREVGAGGMATVYLAEDTKHHRQVAVKVLRPELAASMGSERFLREIEIAAGLSHPHILPLYDSGSSDGVLFYVMPFVDGPSLRDRMTREGALPIADAMRLLREIADALGYAHGRGLIHRDIKPENILLSGTHALVADFGVAKAVSDAAGAASMTATGMALGTPAYMAPEQAMAEPTLDHRVDLYALGVMAYEMLAGRGPFTATSAQQLISAHLTKVPEPVSVHRPEVSAALEAVVMRCLEKDPAARWANAGEVIAALDAVLTPVGTTSPVSAAGSASGAAGASAPRGGAGGNSRDAESATTPAPRRRGPMIAAGAAVLVLALGGFGAMRYTQTGRAGTLIGNDVLGANDLVLVSEFENHSGDSTLAATVTDAVRADLQQSRAVQVMSQAAMWGGLKRMGLERGVALPPQKVQELAEREGAKAFVVGDIARLGAGYQLVARVVATKDGSEQLIARATAKNDAELIGALEDVGRTLRKGIGESLRSVGDTPPLAKVTTASLPALRTYTAAHRAEGLGDRPQAIALAREAIALDSGFASAYALLYVIYSNMDSIAPATVAGERAFALSDRLSEIGRLQAQARVMRVRGDRDGEERAWRRLADMGRDETNYANMLLQQGRVVEAEAMQRRGIVSTPRSSTAYWNLAEAQAAQQHWAAADSTARLVAERLPENPYRYFIASSLLLARRDMDGSEAYLASPDGARMPSAPLVRCAMHLARGRLRAWRACSGRPEMAEWQGPQLALDEFRLTGDTTRARATYAPFLSLPTAQRNLDAYDGMIVLLAEAGHIREAEALLDEWRARTGVRDPGYRADSAEAVGAIAVAKGQWDRALAAYRAWRESPGAGSGNLYNRGLSEAAAIYRRQQQPDSAIALYERALATSSLANGAGYEAGWYPQALVALGELHEQLGHKDKAVDYYRTYLNLMKDADAPIAAQVAEIRERVFKLTGEPAAKR
jgi:tetratricopeptide (TPR) repeat protein